MTIDPRTLTSEANARTVRDAGPEPMHPSWAGVVVSALANAVVFGIGLALHVPSGVMLFVFPLLSVAAWLYGREIGKRRRSRWYSVFRQHLEELNALVANRARQARP